MGQGCGERVRGFKEMPVRLYRFCLLSTCCGEKFEGKVIGDCVVALNLVLRGLMRVVICGKTLTICGVHTVEGPVSDKKLIRYLWQPI